MGAENLQQQASEQRPHSQAIPLGSYHSIASSQGVMPGQAHHSQANSFDDSIAPHEIQRTNSGKQMAGTTVEQHASGMEEKDTVNATTQSTRKGTSTSHEMPITNVKRRSTHPVDGS